VINTFSKYTVTILSVNSFNVSGHLKVGHQITTHMSAVELIKDSPNTDPRIILEVLRNLFPVCMRPFRWSTYMNSPTVKMAEQKDPLIHILCTRSVRRITGGGANWTIRDLLLSFHFPDLIHDISPTSQRQYHKRLVYGIAGGPATHCGRCKQNGMVNFDTCQHCEIRRPRFGMEGGTATHCAECKWIDMICI
jgi:hypothetical protein